MNKASEKQSPLHCYVVHFLKEKLGGPKFVFKIR